MIDKENGIKTYEQIMSQIDDRIIKDPIQREKYLAWIEAEIAQLGKEIEEAERKQKLERARKIYGKLIPRLEVDLYKNTIKYTETTPDGEIAMESIRPIKPKDDFP